jgi:hypothetical protein
MPLYLIICNQSVMLIIFLATDYANYTDLDSFEQFFRLNLNNKQYIFICEICEICGKYLLVWALK